MYYVRYYSVAQPIDTELDTILEKKYGLKCSRYECINNRCTINVQVPECHPKLQEIERIIPPLLDSGDYLVDHSQINCYISKYCEDERLNATHIEIMSSFMKVSPVNPDKVRQGECLFGYTKRRYPVYTHDTYGDPFILRSPVKWRQKYFASTDTDQSILFCSKEARRILTENKITGIIYDPVIRKSTGQPMEDIYRLRSSYTIPNEALVPTNDMVEGFCSKCGMRLLGKTSQKCRYGVVEGAIDPDVDFCETMPMMVGRVDGDNLFYAAGISYLISQRMYRVLKENKMDRALMLTPLETVEPKNQL